MSSDLRLLNEAIRPGAGDAYRWQDLLGAMYRIIGVPLTPEAERLLLTVLRFDGQIRIDASSEFPHSMSPEDMLKSLAIQALGRSNAGQTFVPTMRRLQIQARGESPALASVIDAVIKKIGRAKRPKGDLEQVAEIRYAASPEAQLEIRQLRHEQGLTYWADRPIRRGEPQHA